MGERLDSLSSKMLEFGLLAASSPLIIANCLLVSTFSDYYNNTSKSLSGFGDEPAASS
jgi:hypothetical protein